MVVINVNKLLPKVIENENERDMKKIYDDVRYRRMCEDLNARERLLQEKLDAAKNWIAKVLHGHGVAPDKYVKSGGDFFKIRAMDLKRDRTGFWHINLRCVRAFFVRDGKVKTGRPILLTEQDQFEPVEIDGLPSEEDYREVTP